LDALDAATLAERPGVAKRLATDDRSARTSDALGGRMALRL
jgi:hypothetical protein